MKTTEMLVQAIFTAAWHYGRLAAMDGKPRICDLEEKPFVTLSGQILKVYKSAWEQGWENKTYGVTIHGHHYDVANSVPKMSVEILEMED